MDEISIKRVIAQKQSQKSVSESRKTKKMKMAMRKQWSEEAKVVAE